MLSHRLHRIPNTRITPGNKLNFKQTILKFCSKFLNSIFGVQQKKLTSPSNFTYSVSLASKFHLKKVNLFFGPNVLKKGYFRSKVEKTNKNGMEWNKNRDNLEKS